jgi:phosphonate transport system ATP-binding protein
MNPTHSTPGTPQTRPVISCKGLGKTFPNSNSKSLDDVNLQIGPGEFIAVIGLSGAGKSTFLRHINGSLIGTEGKIEVLGQDVESLTRKQLRMLRGRIGFIFQQFNLVKNISVEQNVLCGRSAYTPLWRSLLGAYSVEDKALAKKTLESVGLGDKIKYKARELSGGQQQRVAIARALVQEPKIILADEPMASLDPKLSEIVLEILDRVNREQGITVLVNIHVLEMARKYARRMIAFRRGKVVFDGPPSELTEEKLQLIYNLENSGLE